MTAIGRGTDLIWHDSEVALQIVFALGVFVVFGAVAAWMGRIAANDWRKGSENDDKVMLLASLEEWWPTLIAAAVAVIGPIVILVRG